MQVLQLSLVLWLACAGLLLVTCSCSHTCGGVSVEGSREITCAQIVTNLAEVWSMSVKTMGASPDGSSFN